MAHFQYQGQMLYFEEHGEGNPLLLLPSDTLSSKMYMPVTGLYRNRYRLFLMDFLGTGQSERLSQFPQDFWFDRGQQIIALLQQQIVQKVVLVGTGGGALAALNAALEKPALIQAVIADSVPGEYNHSMAEQIQAIYNQQKQESNRKCLWLVNHGADWEQVIDQILAAEINHGEAIKKFFHRDLSEIQVPVLFTANRHDRLLPNAENIALQLAEIVPKGDFFIFRNGEKNPILANGAKYAQLIKDFLHRMCSESCS